MLMICFAGASTRLLAQGTNLGTIRGAVTDASGAVVPKAKVIILDLATNTLGQFFPHHPETHEP